VVAQGTVHVHEQHALLGQLFLHAVVDHLAVVLGADAGQKAALGLGDAQAVEGALHALIHLVPGLALLVLGAHEVKDVVEVDVVERVGRQEGRHRLLDEEVVGPQAEIGHPLRLLFQGRDLAHNVRVQALLGLEGVFDVVVMEAVFIVVLDDAFDLRLQLFAQYVFFFGRHGSLLGP